MQVKKLFINLFLLALPMLIIVVVYVIIDPFRIIYPMKAYYPDDGSIKNVDYITGEVYLNNSDKKEYDSFIFGSSRSEAFKASKWNKYIVGNPFHFHASCEGIWGISKKIRFLDERGVKIKNVLLVLDNVCLNNISNPDGIVLIKHPGIAGSSWEAFHIRFFKAFMKDLYFYKFINYKYFGGPYYKGVADIGKVTHNPETNDVFYTGQEDEIAKDSVDYYAKFIKEIGVRITDTIYDKECINNKNTEMIDYIASVFKKHNTQLKVVVSPMSNNKFFNPKDLGYLRKSFGEGNVYDFSGINYFTSNLYNYYDINHFKPIVADSILRIIYSNLN